MDNGIFAIRLTSACGPSAKGVIASSTWSGLPQHYRTVAVPQVASSDNGILLFVLQWLVRITAECFGIKSVKVRALADTVFELMVSRALRTFVRSEEDQ